jgi:hypothetical protein
MSQLFRPGINNLARVSLLAGLLIAVIAIAVIFVWARSPYTYDPVGIAVAQPVRFSHQLHADRIDISCQYCHTSAEKTAYAGIPDTHTCMSCHSQIATYSELLEPVRNSYATEQPLVWNKVHDLAGYAYFNHSIHVAKGVGCETCHGRVDQMPLVWQNETMTMAWCLDCHTAPEKYLRPTDEVYTMGWVPPIDQEEFGLQMIAENHVSTEGLTNCAVCHR